MKSRISLPVVAATLFAVLVTTLQLAAQDLPRQGDKNHHRYKLIDLGTFGGPQSYVNFPDISYAQVLNNRGMVAGWADTSAPDPYPDFCFADCFVAHTFQWQHGVRKDLGVLPGGASSQGNWISGNGLIAGTSQNGEIDPLVPGFPELRAVLWKNGEITNLGTLDGGYESIASAVNSRGQVVGFATNTIPDADSMFGLGYQTRAFLWQNGAMQDLGTLGTGTNAMALLVNERGQVAGNSYTSMEPNELCAQEGLGSLTTGAFLWDHGTMVDLGNFGGSCTFASAMNDRGQVVGGSRLAGDQAQHPFLWNGRRLIDLGTFGGDLGNAIALNGTGEAAGWATYPGDEVFHAALWKHGKTKDLGTLEGDSASFAFTINATGQVVGVSVPPDDFSRARPFLWEDGGPMVDLTTLIAGGTSLRLTEPETINDRGEIAGNGLDADGNQHAFLLIPCDAGTEGCGDAGEDPNGAQSRPAPMTSPATTATQPNLNPRGMAARSRARLAQGYRRPAVATPASPHDLTASAQNTYQIILNWQEASGQNQSGFNIYRCRGCSSPRTQGTKIASVGASVLTYTDGFASHPLHESTTYTYQVTAFNDGGESGPSNAASATTNREPVPTNLTSFAFRRGFDDIVRLSWTNNSTDDDSYHIERCAGASCTNFSEIAQTGANATTYTDYFQFQWGKTFRYRVRAHSPGGYSGYSNIRTQTLP